MPKVTRFLLITLNVGMLVTSLFGVGFGIYLLRSSSQTVQSLISLLNLPKMLQVPQEVLNGYSGWPLRTGAWTMMISSGLVGIVSFLGFFAAVSQDSAVLIFYAIVLFFMAAGKLVCVSVMVKNPDQLTQYLEAGITKSIENSFVSLDSKQYLEKEDAHLTEKSLTTFLGAIQANKQCCFMRPEDKDAKLFNTWRNSRSDKTQQYPMSCCSLKEGKEKELVNPENWKNFASYLSVETCPKDGKGLHKQSCFNVISNAMRSKYKLVIIVLSVAAGIELLFMLLALLFGQRKLGDNYED